MFSSKNFIAKIIIKRAYARKTIMKYCMMTPQITTMIRLKRNRIKEIINCCATADLLAIIEKYNA